MDERSDLKNIIEALEKSWSAETAYDSKDWSPENPSRGQCAVSSLVVQDYLGGEIIRFDVEVDGNHEKHYANIVDGKLIDVTRGQFPDRAIFVINNPNLGEFASLRHRLLSDKDTRRRYAILRCKFRLLVDGE